eukprot:Hpha_TRINITY_DN14334_c0_g1::TRINITY_DN14334_c0_g1_i2::g.86661::m.86661/K04974/TRPV5; transient receptor potential cation channel subfamily V member 5
MPVPVTTPQRRPFRGRDPSTIADLKLFWHAGRADHLLTATSEGEAEALREGFVFVRVVGAVLSSEEEGTVSLGQYYHSEWEDHALLSSPEGVQSAVRAGYQLVRREGFLYPFRNSVPGSVPLTTYWSEQRHDTVGVADSGTAVEVVEAKSYNLRRIEGRILPPTSAILKSPSPVRSSGASSGVRRPFSREDDGLPGMPLGRVATEPATPNDPSPPPAVVVTEAREPATPKFPPPAAPECTSLGGSVRAPQLGGGMSGGAASAVALVSGSGSPPTSPKAAPPKVKKEKPPPREFCKEDELRALQQVSPDMRKKLNAAAKSIQGKYRGHQTRKRFLQLKDTLMDSVLSVTEKQRIDRKLSTVDAALKSLNEALATLGTDVLELSDVKSTMKHAIDRYHQLSDEQLERREVARKRLARLRGMATLHGEEEEEEAGGIFSKIKNSWGSLMALVGLSMDRSVDDQLDSQQNTWQTEPIFRACVEGDLEEVKSILTEKPQKIQNRDDFGATILCVCLLINTHKQQRIANYLLECHPYIAREPYTTPLFKGEIPLHFPIVKRDVPMTMRILQVHPEGLLARATGDFFKSPDGGCYFGEYPLFFAVCTNQPDLVLLLLAEAKQRLGKTTAEMLDMRDTDGNSVLHLCVWHNLPDMYELIEKLCIQEPQPDFYKTGLQGCYNMEGYTPFTLAAKLGKKEVFRHLLERNTQETWQFGPHSYRAVFIDEIEPADITNTEKPTVLQLLVQEEHRELLNLDLIRAFLVVKWESYVKKIFMKRLIQISVYTVAFICFVVLSPTDTGDCIDDRAAVWELHFGWLSYYWNSPADLLTVPDFSSNLTVDSARDFVVPRAFALGSLGWCELGVRFSSVNAVLQSIATFVVLTGAFHKGTKEAMEVAESGVQGYFGVKGSMLLENILSASYCTFMVLHCITSWLAGGGDGVLSQVKTLSLAVAALALCSYHLLLMLAFKTTGPFIIMIVKMLISDMAKFMVIFIVFLSGFAQAFHIIFDQSGEGWMVFLNQLREGFEVLLGEADLKDCLDPEKTSVPIAAYFLQVLYVVIVTILLVNLLIAMMSTTYGDIQEESDVIWNLERSRLCLSLENELDPAERSAPGNKYWTVVDGRRCYMLPMLTDEGMERYFVNYKPNWEIANSLSNKPEGWVPPFPKRPDDGLGKVVTTDDGLQLTRRHSHRSLSVSGQ